MNKPEFPNDWPLHFNESMVFPPIASIAPVGSNKMGFQDMDYQQFEQFCWFLLQKDYRLEGCQHIGASGTKQSGIDLFARDKFNTSQLIMFECKCWDEFDKTNLRNAVDKFVDSPWIKYKPKFILIIAQEELGSLSETWIEQSTRLDKLEIQSDVWTGKHLASRVQHFPDIVTRFFRAPATQIICHDWMRKVRFIERLHYAYNSSSEEIRELAIEFMGDGNTGKLTNVEKLNPKNTQNSSITTNNKIEQIFENSISWTIDWPSVYIQCFKPKSGYYPSSALINIRQENASGVDVALTQKWLLKNMLGAEGAPIDHLYRPFIINEFKGKSNQLCTIELQNCRLYPPRNKMEEICDAVDRLSQVVTKELHQLEEEWGAVDFPFVYQGSSTYVAICEIPKWLWSLILEYCCEHDIDKGETEWHIFDQNHWYLKVFTKSSHQDFDHGYHGIFQIKEYLEDKADSKSVTILWQPPDSFEKHTVDKRKWMPCSFALAWITDKLIPKVKEWYESKKEIECDWERDIPIYELKESPLLRDQLYITLGVVKTVQKLQATIDSHGRAIYLTADEIKNLYEALILILEFKLGYAPYLASNLNIRGSTYTHDDIINALRKRVSENDLNLNMFALQHMLSAFLEALNDNEDLLLTEQKNIVFHAMFPIMSDFDKRLFFQRHTKWID